MIESLLLISWLAISTPQPIDKTAIAIERIERLLPGLDLIDGVVVLTKQSKKRSKSVYNKKR